ncbi:MAG TPA: DUF5655 domain-containing protein [Euzebyales bacterium]
MTPDDFLGDSVLGANVFAAVERALAEFGNVEVTTTRSQIAFRRRRGFVYLWLPGKYLKAPQAEVVLSIAMDRKLTSRRFKEVTHASPRIWQHHLEIRDVADVDAEVQGWLLEAYERAA